MLGMSLIFCTTSCDDDDTTYLKRGTDELSFSYLNSTKELVVKSNVHWTATASEGWISCTPSDANGTGSEQYVQITVEQNDGEARNGVVTISDGTKNLAVNISQEDGLFTLGTPTAPVSLNLGEELVDTSIDIPFYKSKPGYTATVTAELSGPGAEGLSVTPVTDYSLGIGEGTLSLYFNGTPSVKGLVNIALNVKINELNINNNYDLSCRVKTGGEVSVSIMKLFPRLAVFDWGRYERGSAMNVSNGTPRSFIIELAESEDGAYLRHIEATTAQMLPSASMFFDNNRFAFGNLQPGHTYWFRIVAREVGANKEDSDVTAIEFTTPNDEVDPNTILYRDFDDFGFGGCQIYKGYGMAVLSTADMAVVDPDDPNILASRHNICHPMISSQLMFNYVSSATDNRGPVKAATIWKKWWEGDKYGTNYSDEDYPGWKGFNLRTMTGGVLLGTASATGYIKTPLLLGLGDETANVTFTCNTAAYYEDYHSYGEDNTCHYIKLEGDGEIVSCATKVEPTETTVEANSSKCITVKCNSNVDKSTRGPINDYMVPTQHVVKIKGATKNTRIVIETHPYNAYRPRLCIDDVKVTKD